MKINDYKVEKELVFIILVCLVLYFQNAWVPGFFHDGYLYTAFGKNAAELNHWLIPFLSKTEYPRFDQHPPFYFILEGLWFKVFPFSWTSARVFASSFILGFIIFFYNSVKELINKKTALYSSVAFLLFPSVMKKARFPNLDIPLMVLMGVAVISLILILKKRDSFRYWAALSIASGLALLIKGAAALIILSVITAILVATKEGRNYLTSYKPYLALLITLMLFSLWPLALYLQGEEVIFLTYLKSQVFKTVVDGREAIESDYFLYFKHLAKTSIVWIILAAWKGKSFLKREPLVATTVILWFVIPFVCLSLMTWKYSNYILPLYPPIAILTGFALSQLSKKVSERLERGFSALFLIFALLILIFPLTNKARRHTETFELLRRIERKSIKPRNLFVIDDSHEYYSTASLFSIYRLGNPLRKSSQFFANSTQDWRNDLILVPRSLDPKSLRSDLRYELIFDSLKKNFKAYWVIP